MTAQADARLVSLFRSLSKISGSIVGLTGALVLAGWIFNVPSLKRIFPNTPQMVPNMALAFILTGASLRMLLSAEPPSRNRERRIAQLCAIATGLLAMLTLVEYALGLNLGIDQLLPADTGASETAYPGRMSPHTAFTFILVSIALLLIDVKKRLLPAQYLAVGAGFISLLALAGYAYGVSFLFSISNTTGMALHTAVSFMILCLGILFARPDQGFMTLIASKSTGGFVTRRFLPIAVAVPLALGWLRLKGEQAGFYSTEVGLLLFAISNILILSSIIWWYSRSLDKTDRERRRSEEEIRLLQAITQGITEAEDFDSAIKVVLQKVCETTGWALGEVWLPSPDGSCLQCSPSWYSPIKGLEKFRQKSEGLRFQKGVGLPGRVWSSKRSAWIPDVTEDPNFPRALLAKEVGLKAGMSIPILAGTEVVAVMDFFVMDPRKEDERLIGLIATIAAQLGTVFQRKQAEEGLKQYAAELEKSNKELQNFAYVTSHDLQEPLRMISSYLQLIERRYKERLDEDGHQFIAYAVDGASRLQTMINGLLSYSRVRTQGKPFGPADCESILEQTLINLKVAIEESHAVITHDPLPTVTADGSQLISLFQNLIINAIKFRGDKPPAIHVSALQTDKDWVFSVRDNGIGIAPEYHERIFAIFQRLHGMDYPGIGIGLSICRRIAERHGGRLWVESMPGTGSTFYFTIPMRGGNPP